MFFFFLHISDVCFQGNGDFKDIKWLFLKRGSRTEHVLSLKTHRQLVARNGNYSVFSFVPEFRCFEDIFQYVVM